MDTEFDPVSAGEPTTFNLLFVCTGNTCRSPMAAAIARAGLARRGWTHVAVRSAGVAASNGHPISPEAVEVLAEHGIDDARNHTATALTAELVDSADMILVMSSSHLAAVVELGGGNKAALMTDFIEGDEAGLPVEDPIGAGIEAYRRTYEQLERAIDGLLVRLEPILSP